jgi:hypothetical protein
MRLGVNRAEGSTQIRRERISRTDRLTDALTKGCNPHGVQAELETNACCLAAMGKLRRWLDVE